MLFTAPFQFRLLVTQGVLSVPPPASKVLLTARPVGGAGPQWKSLRSQVCS